MMEEASKTFLLAAYVKAQTVSFALHFFYISFVCIFWKEQFLVPHYHSDLKRFEESVVPTFVSYEARTRIYICIACSLQVRQSHR